MTTEEIYKDGLCGKKFRVKRWKQGFSIKCSRKTILCRPYYEDHYQTDVKSWCKDCKEVDSSMTKRKKRKQDPIIPEGDSFYAEYCREFSGAGAEQ
jgi:hypothetical protein